MHPKYFWFHALIKYKYLLSLHKFLNYLFITALMLQKSHLMHSQLCTKQILQTRCNNLHKIVLLFCIHSLHYVTDCSLLILDLIIYKKMYKVLYWYISYKIILLIYKTCKKKQIVLIVNSHCLLLKS